MEVAVAVERRDTKETPAQRLMRETGEFFVGLARLLVLAAILACVILSAVVTADLPIRAFDHHFTSVNLKPGNWLTIGGLYFVVATMVVVLFSRRFGGDEAARAITAAWTIAALAVFAELTYLAPRLESGDFPDVRLIVAIVASAMAAQYVAAAVYDVTRGGSLWWRAPLFALLAGNAAHVLIFYPVTYWSTKAPWLNWLVTDFSVKAALSVMFLPIYWFFRKRLRPRGGFGG